MNDIELLELSRSQGWAFGTPQADHLAVLAEARVLGVNGSVTVDEARTWFPDSTG